MDVFSELRLNFGRNNRVRPPLLQIVHICRINVRQAKNKE